MSSNVDILVHNQMMSMYSENENAYWQGVEQDVFTEVDDEND